MDIITDLYDDKYNNFCSEAVKSDGFPNTLSNIVMNYVTLANCVLSIIGLSLLIISIRRLRFNDSEKVLPSLEAWCLFLFLHSCMLASTLLENHVVYKEMNARLFFKVLQQTIVGDRAMYILSSIYLLLAEVRFFFGLQINTFRSYLNESTMIIIIISFIVTYILIFYAAKGFNKFITCYDNVTIFYVTYKKEDIMGNIIFSIYTSILPIVFGLIILFILFKQTPIQAWVSGHAKSSPHSKNPIPEYHKTDQTNENPNEDIERSEEVPIEFRLKVDQVNSSNDSTQIIVRHARLLSLPQYSMENDFFKLLLINWCAYSLHILGERLQYLQEPIVKMINSALLLCHFIPPFILFPDVREKFIVPLHLWCSRK